MFAGSSILGLQRSKWARFGALCNESARLGKALGARCFEIRWMLREYLYHSISADVTMMN